MTDGFFQRFRFPGTGLAEVREQIAAGEAAIAGAAASPATLAALISLGFCLIPLDREAEAAVHLEAALAMARQLGERDQEISALLHLATARQYLGQHAQAQVLFQEGLDKSAEYGRPADRHYLLHHRARCYAEQGRLAEARDCLERALALRRELGEQRFIDSTQDALTALARLDPGLPAQ